MGNQLQLRIINVADDSRSYVQEIGNHNKYRYAPLLLQLLVFLTTLSIILALFIPSYHCVIPTSNGGCSLGSLIKGDTSDFFFFERRKKQILTNNKCLFPTTTATFVHAFNPTSIPLHRRWIHTSSPPPSSSSSRLHLRRPPGNYIDFTVHQQHQRRKELQAFSTPKNETSNHNASLDAMEEKEINSIPRLPDFQKWDSMTLPNVTATVSLASLPNMKIPPLPSINITMPKVDRDCYLSSEIRFSHHRQIQGR